MEMKNYLKNLSMKTKVIAVVAILVVSSLIYKWYSPTTPPSGVVTTAPPAKAVVSVEKKEVPATKLVVYDKEQVAKKITLPEDIKADRNKQVTSVSDVKPSKAGTTVTTITDVSTGVTAAYQEQKKQPLFGWGGEARIGIGYGISNKGPETNVHGEYQFIRIGSVYGNVRGELNTRGEVRGTVNADYQW